MSVPIAQRFGSYLSLISSTLRWKVTAQLLCDREFFITFLYPRAEEEYTLHHSERDADMMTVCSLEIDTLPSNARRTTNEILARINDFPLASITYLRGAEAPRLVGRSRSLCLRPEDAETVLQRCCRSLASLGEAYRYERGKALADSWLFFAVPGS